MKSSSIYIKFNSEAEFERLTFPSQVVSYDEIKKYLEKKKKIGIWPYNQIAYSVCW